MSQLLSAAHQSHQQFGANKTLFTLLGASCVHAGLCFFESELTERYDFQSDMTGSRKWLQLTLK
jgi:hypothetical protein